MSKNRDLPGNASADDLIDNFRNLANKRITSEDLEVAAAQANAIMALAYEQRTANLIARAELALKIKRVPAYPSDETLALVEQLDTRLGLDKVATR